MSRKSSGTDSFPVIIKEFDVNKKTTISKKYDERFEIVKNKIHYITKLELQDRLPFSGFVAIFDGKQIQNKEELFRFLEKMSDFLMPIIGHLLQIG